MVELGNLLSGKIKENLILSSVEVGDVFRMHLGSEEKVLAKHPGEDGRNKYFIVLVIDEDNTALGLVLIESEINQHLPQIRQDLHYPLEASKYPFLNGQNRYVDCSDLKEITSTRFASLFSGEKEKGHILQEDLDCIIEAVASYEDAEPKLLKKFGLKPKKEK